MLKAYWVVLLCDDIVCAMVAATVLTCGRSLVTVMFHVLLHFFFPAILTTAKGTSNHTLSSLRIKVVLEVPYLTHPLTPFLVVMAVYFETVHLSLKSFISSSFSEHVRLTTNGTLTFACLQQSVKACVTQVVSTIGEERLSE